MQTKTIMSLSLTALLANLAFAQTTVLDELNISGQATAPSNNYMPDAPSSAKTSLPNLELPKTVTTVNAQVIEDLNATRVDDLYEYVGGVSRKENHGGLWDGIIVRGFSNGSSALVNGFAVARGYSEMPRDLANVEKIEFIKGPAGSLYGTGEPGGVVSIITKQAHFEPSTILKVQGGNHNYQRTTLDVNTPLNDASAYRLNLAVENADSWRTKYVTRNRFIFAPTAIYNFNNDANLEYSGEYIKNNTVMDRGIVVVNGNFDAMNKKTWLGDPNDGDISTSNLKHQLKFNQQINDIFSFNIASSFGKNDLYGLATTPGTAAGDLAPNGDLKRTVQLRDYHSQDVNLMAEAYVKLHSHELLIGLEKWRVKLDNLWGGSTIATNPYVINIYNPVYHQAHPVLDSNSYTWETQNNNAIYVQDTLSLGEKWRFVAGARVDDFHKRTKTAPAINGPFTVVRESETAVSPSLSVSFLPISTVSIYSSVGQAVKPNGGTDFTGNTFDPQKSTSFEVGTKYENSEQSLGAQFAVFEVRKKNIKTDDLVNIGFSTTTGEVKSTGAELDLTGQLAKVRLTTSFTYVDAKVHKDNKQRVGERLREVERVNAAILAMYEDNLSIGKYGVGLGTNYVAKRPVNQRTKAQYLAGEQILYLPSYNLWRASAYLNVRQNLKLTLDIENLTDKTYYFGSLGERTVMLGEPLTAALSANLKF